MAHLATASPSRTSITNNPTRASRLNSSNHTNRLTSSLLRLASRLITHSQVQRPARHPISPQQALLTELWRVWSLCPQSSMDVDIRTSYCRLC